MAYWHQDESGEWYFDWSHIVPVLPVLLYGAWVIGRAIFAD